MVCCQNLSFHTSAKDERLGRICAGPYLRNTAEYQCKMPVTRLFRCVLNTQEIKPRLFLHDKIQLQSNFLSHSSEDCLMEHLKNYLTKGN